MAGPGKVQVIRSSLPYQLLLYCNAWYFAFFFIAEILIFVYKAETLPFPRGVLAAEIILLFVLAGLEAVRIFFGQKGNLTERGLAVVLSVVFSTASLIYSIYLLIWQTYVLRVEVILNAIQITLIGLQFIFAIVCVIMFARATPY